MLALIFLSLGALLVSEGDLSAGDLTHSARIIGGALLLAGGFAMPMLMNATANETNLPVVIRDV